MTDSASGANMAAAARAAEPSAPESPLSKISTWCPLVTNSRASSLPNRPAPKIMLLARCMEEVLGKVMTYLRICNLNSVAVNSN